MVAAPFFHVGFADFWLADQFNSLVTALLDYQFLICFYITNGDWLEARGSLGIFVFFFKLIFFCLQIVVLAWKMILSFDQLLIVCQLGFVLLSALDVIEIQKKHFLI